MDKDEGRLWVGIANPASLYVLSLPSLLTLSVFEPQSHVSAPRGGLSPGAKTGKTGFCNI